MPIAPPRDKFGAHTAAFWENYFRHHYGKKGGDAYAAMVRSNPDATPDQVAQAFLLNIATKGFSKALADAMSGTAAAVGQAAKSGFGTTALGGGQDWQHLFIRLAEFAIGAALIVVGLQAMLRHTEGYQKTKSAVIGVVGVTPPARAARVEMGARRQVRKTAEESAITRRASRLRNERLAKQKKPVK